MGLYQRLLVRILSLAVMLLSLPLALHAEEILVAKVGNVPVTKYEVYREQQKIMPMNSTYHGGISDDKMQEIREKAVAQLIERAYKLNYAAEAGITVDKDVMEARFKEIQKGFSSFKEFKKATGKEGVDEVKASLQRELLAVKVEKMAIDDKVNVGDAELREYFEKNRSSFMRPMQFKASQIMVKVDPAATKEQREERLKKAKELAARAKAGEDFYNLAYYNSDDRSKYVGGDLGTFHEGQTVKEFEAALKGMKPGEISDPIRTLHGYHIIKLVEKDAPQQLSFEEMKDKLQQSLSSKKRAALYAEWMKGLKAKYAVKRY